KGMILLDEGNQKAAEKVFLAVKNEALKVNSNSWVAISNMQLALISYQEKKYAEALLLLNDARKYNYNSWELKMMVSYHLLRLKIYDKLNESPNVRDEFVVLEKIISTKKREEYLDKLEEIVWAKGIAKKHEGKFEESFALLDSANVLSI